MYATDSRTDTTARDTTFFARGEKEKVEEGGDASTQNATL
jgi:hypothetical protein